RAAAVARPARRRWPLAHPDRRSRGTAARGGRAKAWTRGDARRDTRAVRSPPWLARLGRRRGLTCAFTSSCADECRALDSGGSCASRRVGFVWQDGCATAPTVPSKLRLKERRTPSADFAPLWRT